MSEPTSCVFVANGQLLAEQVRSFLQASGVGCILRGESLSKTHGLTLDGSGESRAARGRSRRGPRPRTPRLGRERRVPDRRRRRRRTGVGARGRDMRPVSGGADAVSLRRSSRFAGGLVDWRSDSAVPRRGSGPRPLVRGLGGDLLRRPEVAHQPSRQVRPPRACRDSDPPTPLHAPHRRLAEGAPGAGWAGNRLRRPISVQLNAQR